MNTDIIARWRDAINDPPPEFIAKEVRNADGRGGHLFRFGNRWLIPGSDNYDPIFIEPGDQWLDITDVPAVAVARVQAAVDAIQRAFGPCACGSEECATCDLRADHGILIDAIVSDTLGRIRHFTGVTPSEVTP